MTLSIWHIIGIIATLALIIGVGIYSGSKVTNAADFTNSGGKATASLVGGAIMGSLVSGQASVGTAQLAFTYGLSAWWFTLGSGIGCLILAIGYVIPLRRSGSTTLLQVISNEYGLKAGYLGTVLCSIGIFISIIAQVLSSVALLTTILPVSTLLAAIISIVVMAIYVIFGGAWGAGMGGVVKLILLYAACIFGCILVLLLSGSVGNVLGQLQNLFAGTPLGKLNGLTTAADVSGRFTSLIARGASKDIGSGVSLVVGVLSTQTYAQAIWSGKSDSTARKGALLSALLIPPIGIGCILIGLFMRGHYITTAEIATLTAAGQSIPAGLTEIASTAQAFPMFVLHHMPPLFGGVVLGTLFITIVGGGAGLSLGVATILVNDIFKKVSKRMAHAQNALLITRVTILVLLAAAAVIAIVVPGAVINDFGFLSMGFRGSVVFIPMTAALFFSGKIDSRLVVASIVISPVAVLVGNMIKLPFDSLFLGMAVSLMLVLIGALIPKKTTLSN